ncbi:MAG: bifunctional 5,10-methylenetetrahydrofolate dehydrogenase/5,10-methenyltetrahydrofolate cyclohydrolase [Candidatus Doudnabacteria bacterium]|nr:bifunctional 5,10-methylenetetrahydrofolate dehydrogenase/5,10-methenyltetrahydrofolate cyclohydrolase [Candidatus Doudnabacteria bacterium]
MLIDGKQIAADLYGRLRQQVQALPVQPVLCDIVVGEDPVQQQFVRVKARRAAEVGMVFRVMSLPADASETAIKAAVLRAADSEADGVIVQLPLPAGISTEAVLACIPSAKDVDGLVPGSVHVPPTARAVVHMLDSLGQNLTGLHFVVVGQGRLVGKPVTQLLQARKYTVAVVDATTPDIAEVTRSADVLISAVGRPGLIATAMVKPGAIIIDAGTSESGGSVVGDVASEALGQAAFATPVPGGVGPVTVAMLFANVLRAAEAVVDKED